MSAKSSNIDVHAICSDQHWPTQNWVSLFFLLAIGHCRYERLACAVTELSVTNMRFGGGRGGGRGTPSGLRGVDFVVFFTSKTLGCPKIGRTKKTFQIFFAIVLSHFLGPRDSPKKYSNSFDFN
jgi:hypothetical protein